ncbi:MAG: KTSC domain-containing protein [Hyphomicrobiales bacterium]|nr:MAG: KTSC domain-containing protein [Hyphomicrobiales bacterium]
MPSAAVRDIEYDPESETLWVTFVPTGKRYAYRLVPLAVYDEFIRAFSKGTYFNRFIRDRYGYSEVDADE